LNSGLRKGTTAEITVTVTQEMLAVFYGQVVHPVMSTVSMIYYMELSGRHVILPYLDEQEVGCGYAVDIKHVGPAVIGQEVTFRAVCVEVSEKRVVCEVTAHTSRNQVGMGTFTQAIFNKHDMSRKFHDLQAEVDAEKNKYDRTN
jgi:fluoroacetyl-CoA thioesterase